MLVAVWSFRVRPGLEADFERAYGPDGDWVRLLRRADGYLGTELLRDVHQKGHYLNLDRWLSAGHRDRFRAAFAADYEALDKACEALSLEERHLGDFTLPGLPPPAPAGGPGLHQR